MLRLGRLAEDRMVRRKRSVCEEAHKGKEANWVIFKILISILGEKFDTRTKSKAYGMVADIRRVQG